MTQHYLDSSCADDPHALPDVETFQTLHCSECNALAEREADGAPNAEHSGECSMRAPFLTGWFYANLDGGLDSYSGEPSGPYASEAEALTAAREESGFCAHGVADDAVCSECPAPELYVFADGAGGFLHFTRGAMRETNWCSAYASRAAADTQLAALRSVLALAGEWHVRRLTDAEARAWGRAPRIQVQCPECSETIAECPACGEEL
jgi:hypothetical protein